MKLFFTQIVELKQGSLMVLLLTVFVAGQAIAATIPPQVERSYRLMLSKVWTSDTHNYQIRDFKQEHVFEKTDQRYVVLVSFYATVKPGAKFLDPKNKEGIESTARGFTRILIVFNRIKSKWVVDDGIWEHKKDRGKLKPAHIVRLVAHSGFWEAQFKKGKYAGNRAYTIANPNPKNILHPERAMANIQFASQGRIPACNKLGQTRKTARIIQYQKQLPLLLPQSGKIRLLITAKHLIYVFEIVQPRKQATGILGMIYPIDIDVSKLGTNQAYFFRMCGRDIEYGILPIKIVSELEFEKSLHQKKYKLKK